MFDRLGRFVVNRWKAVLSGWLVLAVILHVAAPRWNDVTHDGDLAYLPEALPSVQGERLMARAFPEQKAKSQIAIIVERPLVPLTTADLSWSDALADRFQQHAAELAIVDIWNRNTEIVGENLTSRISAKGQAAVTLLHVKNEFMATDNIRLLRRIETILDDPGKTAPTGLNLGITGSAAIGGDMLRSAAESIHNTEVTTIALVVIILLLVYRAPLLVVIPLITIGVAFVVSTDLLAALTQAGKLPGFSWWHFKVFSTTKIFIVVILFGAGTDFCLFLISRYREELERGLDRSHAAGEAIARVGEALVGSAMTTICGLGMMFFAEFGKFRNSGPAIAVSLIVTLIASLTVAPALLRAFGHWVFWPFKVTAAQAIPANTLPRAQSGLNRFWGWAGRAIVRRPGVILLGSVALLAPLAYQGRSVQLTYDFLNELDKSCPSVHGTELARRHFPAGEMAPTTILAMKNEAHFDTADGEREIARLTKSLYEVKGIESVRSIAEPTGDPPGYVQPFRTSGLKKLAARRHKLTKALYVTQAPELAGDVARFDVVLGDDPFSPGAIARLNDLDAYLAKITGDSASAWNGAQFTYVGTTAGIRDLALVTGRDQRLIQLLVVLAVFVVLMALLRRPLVCAYLIVSVLFSYFVTIGSTELFFTWLYGDTFYGLDWKVPIFLFVILIAVGEDYNIYLVTRVVEEQRRHGPIEGLRVAVARTGGIITSCGVIMAGTFISMTTGTLRGMLELGFALSLGIMLDTCIVRPILVPAFLTLLERARFRWPSGSKPLDTSESAAPPQEAVR